MLGHITRCCFAGALALPLITACGDDADHRDEHDAPMVELEGDAVTAGLDADGVSAVIAAPEPFVRVGVMWDGASGSALELRTRVAADTPWSAWRAPEVTFAEEVAHVARLDVDGPRALELQYRIPAGAVAPVYIAFDLIADVPTIDAADLFDEEDETVLEAASPAGRVAIHSRKEWNARAPKCISHHTPFRATVHHTAGPTNDSLSVPARLRAIQAFHMDGRGWCDIAYNYLVSRDGRVWRGRGARRIGGHTFNENTGNIGISFIGTYTSVAPTKTQMCNTARLLAWIHEEWPGVELNRADVKGHRQYGAQFGSTACPGNMLYNRLEEILAMARNGC
jgi:hypothetical protein